MNSVTNSPCLVGEYSESSENEEFASLSSTSLTDASSAEFLDALSDSSSSINSIVFEDPYSSDESSSADDSISSIDSTSADVVAAPVSSTSPATAANLTSPIQVSLVHPIPPDYPIPPGHPMPPGHRMPLDLPVMTVHPEASVPSTSRDIQENCDDFRFEAARRLSFRNWPVFYVKPDDLVTAGFYYTGVTDTVKCFECQLEVSDWLLAHTPMQVHYLWSPQCRFVRNENCGNVPLGEDPVKVLETEEKSVKKSRYGLQYPQSFNHDNEFLKYIRNPPKNDLTRLGLIKVKHAETVNFAPYESRLDTFIEWPEDRTPCEQLADAGLYYTGEEDYTFCYHCAYLAGKWINRDPWKRHAIASPNCFYVLSVQGSEYVNRVRNQKSGENSTEAPIQATVGNHEGFDNENDTKEMSLAEKVAALEEENRALKNAGLCKICLEREATFMFLPCRHLAACDYCSPAFAQCIICRRKIKAVVRTFLV